MTIAQLEWCQLAESVIAITGKRKTYNHKKNKENQNVEYLIEFDKTTGLKSMWLDYDSLTRLSRMREETLPQFSPEWDNAKVPRTQPLRSFASSRGSMHSRKTKSLTKVKSLPATKEKSVRSVSKLQKPISKLKVKPIKQLWSLLDESTMGRRISFDTHNFCHHCKRVLPMTSLSLCKYNSQKNGLIVPNCLNVNNVSLYNSMLSLTCS